MQALRASGRALDDDELAALLGVRRQAVNAVCRTLAEAGVIGRGQSVGMKIRNWAAGEGAPAVAAAASGLELPLPESERLSEDEVKTAVVQHLEGLGYRCQAAMGRSHGIDIDAYGPAGRVIIEAKGEAPPGPQQVNYFLGALGELIQRMADPDARYALALPDHRQYRGLASRVPGLAWERLQLSVFLVGRSADGLAVREIQDPGEFH